MISRSRSLQSASTWLPSAGMSAIFSMASSASCAIDSILAWKSSSSVMEEPFPVRRSVHLLRILAYWGASISGSSTCTVQVAVWLSSSFAVMTAVPSFSAVIIPFSSTETASGLEEDHVTLDRSTSSESHSTSSWKLSPGLIVFSVSLRLIW